MKALEAKACGVCGRLFRSLDVDAKYCTRSCGNQSARRKAVVAMKTRRRLAMLFGELTERETALVKEALSQGYSRGYHRARRVYERTEAA